eukprot:NODE_29_length_37665_cov_1.081563.p15 type:complete len:255 gc:universal NODE_29_length_37665_cov_1.081563:25394-24630(-)
MEFGNCEKGLAILHLKNLAQLEYNLRLEELLNYKIQFGCIDQNLVKRLVKLRLVLEKAIVLEKLQSYKIDKLSKSLESSNPNLSFKPDLSDFSVQKGTTYKPPKISQTQFYDKEHKKVVNEKKRSKLANSRIMRDFQMEIDDKPEEMLADGTASYAFDRSNDKIQQKIKERESIEEDNFLRIQRTKKDKKMYQKLASQTLNDEMKGLREDFKILKDIRESTKNQPKSNKRAHERPFDSAKPTKFMKKRERSNGW